MKKNIDKKDVFDFRVRIGIIAVNSDNKVLLVKHRKGDRSYYLFPGGGLENNEKIEECAKRELLEETGLDIELGKLLFTSETIYPTGQKHVINFFFKGKILGGTLIHGDGVEETCYLPLNKLSEITLHPPMGKTVLAAAQNNFEKDGVHLGCLWE